MANWDVLNLAILSQILRTTPFILKTHSSCGFDLSVPKSDLIPQWGVRENIVMMDAIRGLAASSRGSWPAVELYLAEFCEFRSLLEEKKTIFFLASRLCTLLSWIRRSVSVLDFPMLGRSVPSLA